jgi:hypothetical protein
MPATENQERGLRLLDTTTTWLAVGHIGALGFLYNAVLTGKISDDDFPVRGLALVFICGAAAAFMFKLRAAILFLRDRWPYRDLIAWLLVIGSGIALLIGLGAPMDALAG